MGVLFATCFDSPDFRKIIKSHKSLQSRMSLSFLVYLGHCVATTARILVCNHTYSTLGVGGQKDVIDMHAMLKKLMVYYGEERLMNGMVQ